MEITTKVISGKDIFKLMDAQGLPLDIINLELEEKGLAFDIEEFIETAVKAGWKRKTTHDTLFYSSKLQNNEEFINKLDNLLTSYYGK